MPLRQKTNKPWSETTHHHTQQNFPIGDSSTKCSEEGGEWTQRAPLAASRSRGCTQTRHLEPRHQQHQDGKQVDGITNQSSCCCSAVEAPQARVVAALGKSFSWQFFARKMFQNSQFLCLRLLDFKNCGCIFLFNSCKKYIVYSSVQAWRAIVTWTDLVMMINKNDLLIRKLK